MVSIFTCSRLVRTTLLALVVLCVAGTTCAARQDPEGTSTLVIVYVLYISCLFLRYLWGVVESWWRDQFPATSRC